MAGFAVSGAGQGVHALRQSLDQPVGDQPGQSSAPLDRLVPDLGEHVGRDRSGAVAEHGQQPTPYLSVGAGVVHRGDRAVHTSAPSSMRAIEAAAACSSSGGRSASTSARSWRVTAASARPSTVRATTRRTLVSTTACRWRRANAATARAV